MDDNLPKDQEQKVEEELSKLEQDLENLDSENVDKVKPQESVQTQPAGSSDAAFQPETSQESLEPLGAADPLPDFSQPETPQATDESSVQIPPSEPVSAVPPKYSTETVEVNEDSAETWPAQPQVVQEQTQQQELKIPEPQVQAPPQEQVQPQEPLQQQEQQPAYMNIPADEQQATQAQQQQPQPEQQIHQKGDSDGGKKSKILMWAGIGLLVVALLVAGGYYFFISSESELEPALPVPTSVETPVPTPTAIPDPTAGWETYTNSEYNLVFKHPSEYTIEENEVQEGSYTQVIVNKGGDDEFVIKASKKYTEGDVDLYLDTESTGEETIGAMTWSTYYLPDGYGEEPETSASIFALQTESGGVLYSVSFTNQASLTPMQTELLSTIVITPSATETPDAAL